MRLQFVQSQFLRRNEQRSHAVQRRGGDMLVVTFSTRSVVELKFEPQDMREIGLTEKINQLNVAPHGRAHLETFQNQIKHTIRVQIEVPDQRTHVLDRDIDVLLRQLTQQRQQLGVPFAFLAQQIVLLLGIPERRTLVSKHQTRIDGLRTGFSCSF